MDAYSIVTHAADPVAQRFADVYANVKPGAVVLRRPATGVLRSP